MHMNLATEHNADRHKKILNKNFVSALIKSEEFFTLHLHQLATLLHLSTVVYFPRTFTLKG